MKQYLSDPMIIGYVLVTVEVGHNREVLEALTQISGVEEIYSVYGVYDIILKVVANSHNELNNVIKSGIRQVKHINATLTMIT